MSRALIVKAIQAAAYLVQSFDRTDGWRGEMDVLAEVLHEMGLLEGSLVDDEILRTPADLESRIRKMLDGTSAVTS